MSLTRTRKFDDDVLIVLRNMQWNEDGLRGVIATQLDRDLYERANEALVAMGGRWIRQEKAHVFATDPRPSVEGLIENGTLTVARDGFFETPREVVEQMLQMIRVAGNVLEPSAGLGAIADCLPIVQDHVFCIEKNEQRAKVLRDKGYHVTCMDFLKYGSASRFDTIVMNPPFEEGQDADHIRHAYNLLARGGKMVSVVSVGPFFRKDRKSIAFRKWLRTVDYEVKELPENAFKKSGTMIRTKLLAIHREAE